MNKQEEQKIREEFDKKLCYQETEVKNILGNGYVFEKGSLKADAKEVKDFLISKIKQREEEIIKDVNDLLKQVNLVLKNK